MPFFAASPPPSPPFTGGGISIPPPYRLHLNLECREFSCPLSLSFPPFSLPIVERACCLPVKRQRIHPLLNQYCANLSATPLSPPRALISAHGITLSFSSPRVLPSTEPDMPPKESIVYSPTSAPSFPPFSPLSICVQILNHVGMGENESGKGPMRRRRKRGWNEKRSVVAV